LRRALLAFPVSVLVAPWLPVSVFPVPETILEFSLTSSFHAFIHLEHLLQYTFAEGNGCAGPRSLLHLGHDILGISSVI